MAFAHSVDAHLDGSKATCPTNTLDAGSHQMSWDGQNALNKAHVSGPHFSGTCHVIHHETTPYFSGLTIPASKTQQRRIAFVGLQIRLKPLLSRRFTFLCRSRGVAYRRISQDIITGILGGNIVWETHSAWPLTSLI